MGIRTSESTFMAGKIVVKIVVGAFCQFNETILLAVHDLFSSHEAILNSQKQK